jgi:hypothetical protein
LSCEAAGYRGCRRSVGAASQLKFNALGGN